MKRARSALLRTSRCCTTSRRSSTSLQTRGRSGRRRKAMTYDPVVTADDVIRAGACKNGVARVLQRLAKKIPAALSVSKALALVRKDERVYIERAAELDGYGYGY